RRPNPRRGRRRGGRPPRSAAGARRATGRARRGPASRAEEGPPGGSSRCSWVDLPGWSVVLCWAFGHTQAIAIRVSEQRAKDQGQNHNLSGKSWRIVSDLIRWFVGSATRIWIWRPRSGAGYGGGYDG